MTQDQIQTISTSTINVESTAKITLTPSDLEVLFLEYFEQGLIFPKPASPTSIINHLKSTLQQTLHFFPPLVARLSTVKSGDGASTCFFLDCSHNEGGVLFIHSTANLTIADVNMSSNSLFPLPAGICSIDGASQPLLAVQLTELADGLFLGWSINQLVADGGAMWHFLNSWAEISREKPISKLPIINRDRMNLDFLGTRDVYIRDEYLEVHNENNSAAATTELSLSERVFLLTKESVAKLKARANKEMEGTSKGKISSLQAVIAHLWRSIIRCRFKTRSLIGEATTFEIPIGARRRMSPPLPDEYFGNAVYSGIVTLDAGEVIGNRLGWAAWQINRMVAMESANGAEKVKDLCVRWAKEPKFLQFDALPPNHFVLINSPRFNAYGNDFGWGPPVAVKSGRGCSFDGRIEVHAGFDEGSLEVEVCVFKETLSAMAEDVDFMEFVTLRARLVRNVRQPLVTKL